MVSFGSNTSPTLSNAERSGLYWELLRLQIPHKEGSPWGGDLFPPPVRVQLQNPGPGSRQRVTRDRPCPSAPTSHPRHPRAAHAVARFSLLTLTETKSNPSLAPAARRSRCLRLLGELSSVFLPAEYDVVGYHNKSQLSSKPIDVLQTGKSICEGYAGLFEQMCR